MPAKNRNRAWSLVAVLLAIILVAVDQATKHYFRELLLSGGPRSIIIVPFFNLTPGWNYGVSFGMLSTGRAGIVIGLTGALTLFLVVWMWRAEDRVTAASLGAMIGGAVGNLTDRLRFGAVFDFLDFHAAGWHWPTFNFADVSIVMGSVGILLGAFDRPVDTKSAGRTRKPGPGNLLGK